MATACEQADERRLDRIGLQVERGDVAVEMVDRGEGQLVCPRERFRGSETDEERPDQARPAGDGDLVDVVERRPGLAERLAQHGQDELEVAPRGDLGDDAAETGVQVGLGRDDVGADLAVPGDERRRGLVAGGLEREYHGGTQGCVRHSRSRAPGPST